jgi:two-component system NtrC family sensor kinase
MVPLSQVKPESQQEKLERLTAEVESLREQLRAAHRLATVGTMTAMVSHELNNILTPIINYAQMARKNPALVEKAIRSAAEDGQRATSICKAILDLSAGAGVEMVEENLRGLVTQSLEAMARDPGKDNISLNIQLPPDLTVRTRRSEFQQVLLNMIMNARSALLGKSGPRRIDLAARREDAWTTISLTDNGSGIAPENIEKVFEPFFTTRNGNGGYGLGLAFCRQTVRSMGGEIQVQSRAGEGTTFTIRLPN